MPLLLRVTRLIDTPCVRQPADSIMDAVEARTREFLKPRPAMPADVSSWPAAVTFPAWLARMTRKQRMLSAVLLAGCRFERDQPN
jgi:hypothetical protein